MNIISVNVENKTVTIRRFIRKEKYFEMIYTMRFSEVISLLNTMKDRYGGTDEEWTVLFDKNEDGGIDLSFVRQYDEVVPATKELVKMALSYVPDYSRRITDTENDIIKKQKLLDNMAIKLSAIESEIETAKKLGLSETHIIMRQTYATCMNQNRQLLTEMSSLVDNLIMYKERQKNRDAFNKLLNEVE